MWCPDGFVLLQEISGACFDLPSDRLRKICRIENADQDGELSTRQQNACAFWIFLRFVERNEGKFYAALPNGRAVRLSGLVTEPYFPIDEKCPSSKKSIDSFLRHAFEPFAALDGEIFTIDLESDPDRVCRLLDYKVAVILKPMNGFPICWKFPQTEVELVEVIIKEVLDDQERIATPPNKGGRTRVRNKAATEFWETFPLGLESVSLSEAARTLGYDRKTLREGLREMGSGGHPPED